MRVGFIGLGSQGGPMARAIVDSQIGLLAKTVQLGSRLGIGEPTLLGALTHGSATSNALSKIADAGSAATFIAAVGDFIGKDVAVVRKTIAELGIEMNRLDDIVNSGVPT
jgi:3-hydroxyisobutyrate dehydrogenase-like beta-hydroxyacid dehydrogenase